MRFSILSGLAMVFLWAALPVAADGGLCFNVCALDRTQCLKDARSVDGFERNENVSAVDVRSGSDASASMERLNALRAEADKRRFERTADCEAAHGRCAADCRTAAR